MPTPPSIRELSQYTLYFMVWCDFCASSSAMSLEGAILEVKAGIWKGCLRVGEMHSVFVGLSCVRWKR